MKTRTFGGTGVAVSALCLGTMRLQPARVSLDAGVQLVEAASEAGVTTWHSSAEYDTHPHFVDILARFRQLHPGRELVHVAKIAAPHFEDAGFDPEVLRARVEAQLRELRTERLDIVQWLARSKPISDERRLPELEAMRGELERVVDALIAEGKVGAWAAFPYSVAWARAFASHRVCHGFVTYLNLLEIELADDLDALHGRAQGFIAIRPLSGGLWAGGAASGVDEERRDRAARALRVLGIEGAALTRFAVGFPLLHPAVAAVMLSVSSAAHLEQVLAWTSQIAPDRDQFIEVVRALRSA